MEDNTAVRIKEIMDYYGLMSSAFADKIGVQRPNISHVLSGRNKPSLDLILKILNSFPDISPAWILTGKGDMIQLDLFDDQGSSELPAKKTSKSVPAQALAPAKKKVKEELKPEWFEGPVEEDVAPAPVAVQTPEPVIQEPAPTVQAKPAPASTAAPVPVANTGSKRIEKIIIFYDDKTFSSYTPEA